MGTLAERVLRVAEQAGHRPVSLEPVGPGPGETPREDADVQETCRFARDVACEDLLVAPRAEHDRDRVERLLRALRHDLTRSEPALGLDRPPGCRARLRAEPRGLGDRGGGGDGRHPDSRDPVGGGSAPRDSLAGPPSHLDVQLARGLHLHAGQERGTRSTSLSVSRAVGGSGSTRPARCRPTCGSSRRRRRGARRGTARMTRSSATTSRICGGRPSCPRRGCSCSTTS